MHQACKIKPHHNLLRNSLILAAYALVPFKLHAALPADAVLAFNPGQTVCLVGGTPPNCDYFQQDVVGSYFAMDFDNDGAFIGNEKTGIEKSEGVRLNDLQPASGSHSGLPDGSEFPSIDMPWAFFGNTGMHQTTTPIGIANGNDGTGDNTASLDFSGWGVTWNGIPDIPLGGDSANFPSDTGVAVLTCSSYCILGDDFTLDYFAHVPIGDASGFGGVYYTLHLEGTIAPHTPIPPTKSVSIQLNNGNTQECTSYGGSVIEATANIVTTDISDIAAINWALDGIISDSGNTANIFVPLGEHILSIAVETLASGQFENSEEVSIEDKTSPNLGILFIDQRTSEEIIEVIGDGKHYVTVVYDVTDICDPEPTASGTAVPVHTIEDGDSIKIDKRQISTTTLGTSAVNVSADAVDISGNHRHRTATLLIVD